MTQEYARYPLTMSHPHFTPAVSTGIPGTEIRDSFGNVTGYRSYHGTSVKFPPVVVTNDTEEAYEASQGYEPAGKVDPSAWIRAHQSQPDPTYKPQKYPMVKGEAYYATAADDPDATPEDLAELEAEVRRTNPLQGREQPTVVLQEDPRIAQMQAQIEALTKALTQPKPRGRPRKTAGAVAS